MEAFVSLPALMSRPEQMATNMSDMTGHSVIYMPTPVHQSNPRNEMEEIERMRRWSTTFTVLYLDGHKSFIRSIESLRGLNLANLEQLSMVNMRMTGLFAIPRMPKLEVLDLSDNRITGNLIRLNVCPKLNYLNLSRNKIKNIETLNPLKNLKCLQSLDLFGNDVIFVANYRQKVFALIKTLRYLDGSIKETEEEEEE